MDILAQILVIAAIGVVLTGIVTVCRRYFIECVKWRQSCGRSNFWPLIH